MEINRRNEIYKYVINNKLLNNQRSRKKSQRKSHEHYAKRNKPGGERQIPHEFTCKWNLNNKTNKQAECNQRHGNIEQTDSDQREG